jgi:OmpA-OmpF porin, OOP family
MKHGAQNAVAMGLLVLAFWISTTEIAGAKDWQVKIKGMITGRTGDSMTLKTAQGSHTVLLDDNSKVQDLVGLGLRKKQYSSAVLIPGLKVTVEGVGGDQDRIVIAKKITFDGDDLETAEMIQAGLDPTQEQVATNKAAAETASAANRENIEANQQKIAANRESIEANVQEIKETNDRFASLDDYDIKGELAVPFAVGKSTIAPQDKEGLKKLARDAVNLNGYLVQVKGFADSQGNAVMNQKLSEDRAEAVVSYLIQDCNVPVRYVVAPGAMGISHPAASNETTAGRAANRRVEVKVLVNKGISTR